MPNPSTTPFFQKPNTNPNTPNSQGVADQFKDAERAVQMEGQNFRDKQAFRYQFIYPQTTVVPNNGQRAFQIVVDADSDFYTEEITGSCLGPTTETGARLIAQPTDFPYPGVGGVGFADRGLMVSIKDGGSRIELTDGFVPVELFFTPGYDIGTFYIPLRFKYYVRRNAKVVFTFLNRDQSVGIAPIAGQTLFHFVAGSMKGFKYLPDTK